MKLSVIKKVAAVALTVWAIWMAIKRNMKEKVEDTKEAVKKTARKAVAKVKRWARNARRVATA